MQQKSCIYTVFGGLKALMWLDLLKLNRFCVLDKFVVCSWAFDVDPEIFQAISMSTLW